ncbi:hypothetical protein BKA66DRAFT_456175 [Pyrenochaeta sp. MPI-SDFR-AT-0127]|nr:hypothetical protein BKA66DRAFT_456175 [Pyrenochaeta sp. MPI-SDFR-AT-0127]
MHRNTAQSVNPRHQPVNGHCSNLGLAPRSYIMRHELQWTPDCVTQHGLTKLMKRLADALNRA